MQATAVSPQTILEMREIKKTYPGVQALSGVSFSLHGGEVHALLGENGAGKSTLMKILAGAELMDSGEIILDGRCVTIDNPHCAMDLGISIIYQEFNLIPHMTVGENIFLGREHRGTIAGFIDSAALYREAQEVIDKVGLEISAQDYVHQLSIAQQQMVEIAKAISRKSRMIIMDEPSATLTDREVDNLHDLIAQLKSEGVSIIYISHRLEEIFKIADRLTVFRDGSLVGVREVARTDREELIRLMVGRELNDAIPKRPAGIGDPILSVSHLSRGSELIDINFTVHKSEILGIAGLVGAGRTEVARCIFGADPFDEGEIRIDGRIVEIRSPQDAIDLGISLVTEDRKAQGMVLGMSIFENATLANLGSISPIGFINLGKEQSIAEKYVDELLIKTPSIDQQVKNLSGGNQQKVVLAKWLFTNSKVLIFDEPTRGIDVGAKSEIYELMNRLAENGVGIIMISSELPEILGMSDRIIVMHEGRITGELSSRDATQESIMHLATGGA